MAKYWTGEVPGLDDFQKPIGKVFIDGKTIYGPWAIMNVANHERIGCGLGQGKGQRYEKQKDGRWMKTAG